MGPQGAQLLIAPSQKLHSTGPCDQAIHHPTLRKTPEERRAREDVRLRAPRPPRPEPTGAPPGPRRRAPAHLQDLMQDRRGVLPHRPRRQRGAGPRQSARRAPALVQGHALQQPDQGRGGQPCVRPRQQGHGARHQALPRPVPPGEAGAVQPGVPGRVGAVDGERRRGQGLPLHPHGEQHPPQLRRLPRRQGPRRRARRHHRGALGVGQGRQPELEDPPLGRRGLRRWQRRQCAVRPRRAHRPHLLQGGRRVQRHRPQRQRVPGAHQPARRVPALGQGHAPQQQHQGRGRVPGVRPRQQGHRRGHQALPGRGPPGEAGAVQPQLPGRVGAVDGEPRRRARLPLHPHGEQRLPQLRRLPRRQGPRRGARRHRRRAVEVVRGRQPALEDRPLVNVLCWGCIGHHRDLELELESIATCGQQLLLLLPCC